MTPKEIAVAIKDKVGSQEKAAELCEMNQTSFGRIMSGSSDPKHSTVERMRAAAKKLKIRGA